MGRLPRSPSQALYTPVTQGRFLERSLLLFPCLYERLGLARSRVALGTVGAQTCENTNFSAGIVSSRGSAGVQGAWEIHQTCQAGRLDPGL